MRSVRFVLLSSSLNFRCQHKIKGKPFQKRPFDLCVWVSFFFFKRYVYLSYNFGDHKNKLQFPMSKWIHHQITFACNFYLFPLIPLTIYIAYLLEQYCSMYNVYGKLNGFRLVSYYIKLVIMFYFVMFICQLSFVTKKDNRAFA